MKLLIDIPEHIYEHAKETTEDSRDEFEAMRAIANGTQQESRSEIPNTCGDAISRQAVLNLMRGLTRWCVRSEDGKWKNVGLLYDDVMFGIDRLPSVTPQQRTGRWIDAEVLDKIRAEIEVMTPTYHNNDWSITDLVPISEVLKIVDKYKAESEDKE